MEDIITLNGIWTVVAWVAAAIVLLSNAAEKVTKIIQATKAPNKAQDNRLTDLEGRMSKVEAKQNRDHDRFEALDDSNRITQRALLALLDHGIDGNNIEQMQHAKEELQNHLINR